MHLLDRQNKFDFILINRGYYGQLLLKKRAFLITYPGYLGGSQSECYIRGFSSNHCVELLNLLTL